MDIYSAPAMVLLWICFIQTVAIGWIFGAARFCDCVKQMTGHKPWRWRWYWLPRFYLVPLLIGGVFIYLFKYNFIDT